MEYGCIEGLGGENFLGINWDWSSIVLLFVVRREDGGAMGFPLTSNSCYKPYSFFILLILRN